MHICCFISVLSMLRPNLSLSKRGEREAKNQEDENKRSLLFESQQSVIHPVYIHICKMTVLRENLSAGVRGRHVCIPGLSLISQENNKIEPAVAQTQPLAKSCYYRLQCADNRTTFCCYSFIVLNIQARQIKATFRYFVFKGNTVKVNETSSMHADYMRFILSISC